MKLTLKLNQQYTENRFAVKYKKAQQWLDNEVLKDSDPYCPFRTGNLARSGQRGTQLGSGKIVYNAVYASRCYYGKFNFSKDKHPLACRQWFEKAKGVNKKKWINGVRSIVKG